MNQLVVIHRMKTLFLRCDPGVNSEVSDRVLPRSMLLFKGVECPHVSLGITRDAGLSSFLSHVRSINVWLKKQARCELIQHTTCFHMVAEQ